ncbi:MULTISPECIES: hypothetical protein [unclassified Wolbachia]|uniref:hypothetical protein n=1 Tax=unclassified Wolbachia TaxID=2640676 RepID=UPI00244E93A5|nr:hypothetical protein [Wolbachia endosymbiont of Frankliniella intonsa]WGJ61679.1 hypothetical protein M3L71_04730 [Wolbachia endosymbiont of Frankliniella intonsa]
MKFGAIVGITAGVGVGNGLFAAAGLSLLISAFIGAAVAIAIGFVVFGITYAMVPSEKLDSVDAEQKASTAASMVV